MNVQELEKLLLLEQSGELSPSQRRALDAELAARPEARGARAQLRALAVAIPPPAAQPAPDAAQRIAARLAQNHRTLAWKPLLAAAAALALLLGIQTFRAPSANAPATVAGLTATEEEWTDPLETDFAELEDLLLAISDESLEFTEL